jgi:hypothetical protein
LLELFFVEDILIPFLDDYILIVVANKLVRVLRGNDLLGEIYIPSFNVVLILDFIGIAICFVVFFSKLIILLYINLLVL